MPGDGTGNDRISPMTLYGVFLKNKVNKTWDAEPRISIICLCLWGREGGGCSKGSKSEARSKIWRERVREKGENREGGRMFWCFWNFTDISEMQELEGKHAAAFSYDRGRGTKEAGSYKPEQCTESAEHCILEIMQQHHTLASVCNAVTWHENKLFSLHPVNLKLSISIAKRGWFTVMLLNKQIVEHAKLHSTRMMKQMLRVL